MRVVILYHPEGEHAGKVLDYLKEHDMRGEKPRQIELVSLETKKGAQLAKLYDVTNYPATLAIAENGSLLKLWQGGGLPPMDEVDYFLI